jgi:hypothetical protein|nr:MAG TPA: hypothetical protein [Caudoviricetes sp.]
MAVSDKDNEIITKTLMWMLNSTQSAVNAEYQFVPQSTINFKYQNFHQEHNQIVPILLYFGLGLNGFYNTDDTNKGKPYVPKAKELDLYQPIPIRCVPVDQDLTKAERANYRMRVRRTVNGLDYYCYYLKKITPLDTTVKILQTDPDTQITTDYEISASDLTPVPVKPTTSGVQNGIITEVNVSFRIELNWLGKEVLEAIEVLYDGDMTMAKISEIGIYSGEDRAVQGYDSNNAEFTYTEAIYTQLAYKACNTGTTIVSPTYNGSRIFTIGDGNVLLL